MTSGRRSLQRRTNTRRSKRNTQRARPRGQNYTVFFNQIKDVLVFSGTALAVFCLLIVISIGLLAGFRYVTTSPYFALTEVKVTGVNYLTEAEVLTLADLRVGQNILDLNITAVQKRVGANPWVASVTVNRVLPQGLEIEVKERQAVFWVHTAGGLCYAEADGDIIDVVRAKNMRSYPVLTFIGTRSVPKDLALQLESFNALSLNMKSTQAAWIKVFPERVELYFDSKKLFISIALASWDEHIKRLGVVWQDLKKRGESSQVKKIIVTGKKVWVTV